MNVQDLCSGVLAYEVMGGVIRVHRNGVYRFRCMKCGRSGENDGCARACTATVKCDKR